MLQTDEYWRLWELVHQTDVAVGVAHHVVEPLLADGMRPDRVRVIHNAVDADRLLAGGDAAGLRASLGIPGEALLAVAIGSLIHRKGHDVTLRGVALARARGADVHLLLCGDGEAGDTLRALAAELGVAEAVHFLGYRADVGAVARAADVCVTSAREEALSLNVLEAQWLGLPVVASDIPGHREGMAPGESGLLVPLEDAQALAARLCELAASPAWRRQLGDHGRRFATEHFRMERYIAEFDALYSDLLARPGRAHGWLRGSAWPAEYTAWLADALRRRVPFI
jgi:glycosyltransferase involved in cell wall biosynthesis